MKRNLSFRTLGLAAVAIGLAALAAMNPAFAAASPAAQVPDHAELTFLAVGMLVNKDSVSNLFISLKTTFNNAFAGAPSQWSKIAMLVPSTTGQNDYAWLSKFPKMREWIGDKVIKSLEAFDYTIKNKDFEATIEVDRNDIKDDNLGIYGPQAQMAGESAAQLPDEIVFALVDAGFTAKCYDGQYFFDTDHPVKDKDGIIQSVSNKGVAVLSIATLAAANAGLGAADTALMEMTDDEGRPLGVKPNVLLVPPALKLVANALMTTDRLEDGKPNPYKGAYEVVVEARLTSRTAWFLLDTTRPVKPFVYQEREKPTFVSQTDPQSDTVFMRKTFLFGAEGRANGGYGFWQMAYGSTGAGA